MLNPILTKECTQFRLFAVLLFISLSFTASHAQTSRSRTTPRSSGGSHVISTFILAIQKREFKPIINQMYSYQSEIAAIKKRNPRVLWDKLLTEYYDDKTSRLSAQQSFWGDYGDSLSAMAGDPTKDIRTAMFFLPSSCKWSISESRFERVSDSILYGPYSRTLVYVTVDYPSIDSSPEINHEFLKQTILVFSMRSGTDSIMSVKRIEKADVFWSKPYPPSAAQFLQNKYLSEISRSRNAMEAKNAINRLVSLGWDVAGPILLAALSNRIPALLHVATVLGEHKDRRAAPIIANLLKERFDGQLNQPGCDDYSNTLIIALGRIGPVDTVPSAQIIREVLSNTLSANGKADCVDSCLQALASLDNPAWRTFRYWYPGGPELDKAGGPFEDQSEFEKVLNELSRQQRSSPAINRSSLNANRSFQYLNRLKPCDKVGSWDCPSNLVMSNLKILSHDRVELIGYIEQYKRVSDDGRPDYLSAKHVVGGFKMQLHSTDNPVRSWMVDDIVPYLEHIFLDCNEQANPTSVSEDDRLGPIKYPSPVGARAGNHISLSYDERYGQKSVRLSLKEKCWTQEVLTSGRGVQIKLMGEGQIIEVFFDNGYRYQNKSWTTLNFPPARAFRLRGIGEVEITAY